MKFYFLNLKNIKHIKSLKPFPSLHLPFPRPFLHPPSFTLVGDRRCKSTKTLRPSSPKRPPNPRIRTREIRASWFLEESESKLQSWAARSRACCSLRTSSIPISTNTSMRLVSLSNSLFLSLSQQFLFQLFTFRLISVFFMKFVACRSTDLFHLLILCYFFIFVFIGL